MGMPKRILLSGLAVIVLVLAGGAAAAYMFLSGDGIKTAIESQASAALGRPVVIGRATPAFFPRVSLDLRDVVIGASREVVLDRMVLSTGVRALFRRRVEDANISVERSRIDIPWARALVAALAAPANAAPVAAPPALTIASIGSIVVSDVSLVAGPRTLLVDLRASLDGDRLVIQQMRGSSPDTTFTASGEVSSLARRTGKLSIDAETMDLDGLMAFMVAATPAGARESAAGGTSPAPSGASPIDLEVAVRAARGRALGLALTNLTTTGRVRGNDVSLDHLKMDLLGGRYDGAAAFHESRGAGQYEWRGAFEGLDVPQLMTFAGAAGAMTGRLSGTVALTAAGTDPQHAMQRARGTARLAISDGRIPGLEIVRSVILAFGKPTGDRPGGSGEAFTRLAATLAIDGMNLSTTDLSLASRDLDMQGQGRLSLATQAVDFTTSVVLSRELSAQAGRDLYRLAREGDRVVLPARITGTVAAPTVFVDVKAALGRALRNQAEDQIRRLFDRWRKKNDD
jgi:uncharacterized protein involved in outer membrane biogenesis